MADLRGKVALVTGAARYRGIGRAIALRLADDGADVVISGRDKPVVTFPAHEQEMQWRGIESLAEEIRSKGRKAWPVFCDITRKDEVVAMIDAIKADCGRLDIIVNNAGDASNAGSSPIFETDEEVWYNTMDGTIARTSEKYHLPDGAFQQSLEEFIPMGRQGKVSELAAVVSFVCSDDASYVTGQTINVDGGARLD